jgi:putative FmdB family regulatory protein
VPLYEYQCKSCHTKTERIQKFSDPPLTVCPHCGGELEQLISAPTVQFKGAGWYVTDYARKGSGGGAPKDGKGTGDSGAKGSGDVSASASGGSSSEASKTGTSTSSEKK